MKALSKLLAATLVGSLCSMAQSVNPAVAGFSYELATPFNVAPGQLVTLLVHLDILNGVYDTVRAPAGANLPNSLAGFTGGYSQTLGPGGPATPFLEVHPYWGCPNPVVHNTCTPLAALTIQVPFEAVCDLCGISGVSQGVISFLEGSSHGPIVYVYTLPDHVHILTACDAFLIPDAIGAPVNSTGLPCPSVVTHLDGSPISADNPAKAGEVVVAYAVGLGQTNPPLATGKLVTAAAPTQTTFTLDFNYRANALATKPAPGASQPIYAGATPGFVGLYQVNFTIPPVPPGTPPCVDSPRVGYGYNVVQSNLTVSVGGQFSFDGARICVAVPSP